MNLRIRVALAAIFSTGLVVLIAGVTLIQLISNNQYAALDRRLTEQTYILEKMCKRDCRYMRNTK